MPLVELVHTIAHTETSSTHDDSLSGVVVFCGISLLLGIAALVLASSGQPSAVMF